MVLAKRNCPYCPSQVVVVRLLLLFRGVESREEEKDRVDDSNEGPLDTLVAVEVFKVALSACLVYKGLVLTAVEALETKLHRNERQRLFMVGVCPVQ